MLLQLSINYDRFNSYMHLCISCVYIHFYNTLSTNLRDFKTTEGECNKSAYWTPIGFRNPQERTFTISGPSLALLHTGPLTEVKLLPSCSTTSIRPEFLFKIITSLARILPFQPYPMAGSLICYLDFFQNGVCLLLFDTSQ